MKRLLILLVLSVAASGIGTFAQTPATLSYQGYLTDTAGKPVADGNQSLAFRLYTTASGGSALWIETHPSVPTSGGVFAVSLGSITSLGAVNFRQPLYIGITRGADAELTPRAALANSPGAMAPWGRGTTAADISFTGGKVGIGTNSPDRSLTVTGDMRLDGTIFRNSTDKFIHTTGVNSLFAGLNAGSSTAGNSVYNTGIGVSALALNTTGNYNTATGGGALLSNSSGGANTAVGFQALALNTANDNTAVGTNALVATKTASYNTSLGANAGDSFDNGWNNVFVGANTDVNQAGLYNVIALGQGTIVGAVSTARFGNSATTSYGGWAGWSNVSDGRFKKNVREDVPGLAFVTRLRPVRYNFDATGMDAFLRRNQNAGDAGLEGRPEPDPAAEALKRRSLEEKEQITYTGFVAQEVETTARALGFDFSGVDGPKNPDDYYSLRYAEFVVPLVKAIQEQQEMIEALQREVQELKARLGPR